RRGAPGRPPSPADLGDGPWRCGTAPGRAVRRRVVYLTPADVPGTAGADPPLPRVRPLPGGAAPPSLPRPRHPPAHAARMLRRGRPRRGFRRRPGADDAHRAFLRRHGPARGAEGTGELPDALRNLVAGPGLH